MEKVRVEVGYKGDLAAFFDYLRTDKAFQPKSREALTKEYYAIGKTVAAKLPAYFSTMPRTALEIRPYDATIEKYQAGGSYEQGTPDGKRPGVFYFNAYDLPSRTTPGITTLYLHEGAPGHHFQISLAQENEALPSFLRFGGNTAYVEGWALYAETLGYAMGVFDDPYQRFGTLVGRDAARDAAGGRYRASRQGLDPRPGDCLHARPQQHRPDRRHRRGRALYRHPRAGAGLQDRRADHPAAARQGRGRAGRQVRHPAIPCRRC